MNSYEERLEERRERLRRKAREARAESEHRFKEADRMAGMMNGQPILIGHHSEKRHRRDLERMENHWRKGSEAWSEAAEYDRRAEAVGSGGISSEDPEAIAKLKEKLAGMEAARKRAKAINAYWRKHGTMAGFPGITAEGAARIDAKMAAQNEPGASWVADRHKVYPGYYFQNLGANIRRVRARIAELEAEAARGETPAAEPVEGAGWSISEHPEESRVWIEFEAKPPREVTQAMRRFGFKWSPSRVAWVRNLNSAGRAAAQAAAEWLGREAA